MEDNGGNDEYLEDKSDLLIDVNLILRKLPKNELENVYLSLKKKPTIEIAEKYLSENYHIQMNTVSNKIEYKKINERLFNLLNEDELHREFQKKKIKFSLGNIKSLLRSDFVEKYNPIEKYFNSLPEWNGRDYIQELADHVRSKDKERFDYHFKKHLVRSVACALSDFANKQCFVLVGGQNNGKSTFCRFITPRSLGTYHAENISTDKDSLIALTENFTILLDELSTLNKVEINALKAVFSQDKVKVRRPYAENATQALRIANFWGNTNKDEFLSDETGSVRWLCLEVDGFDYGYSKKCDMDLVYSQALQLYKKGFEYRLTAEDILENEDRNSKYQITTPEMEAIASSYEPIQVNDFDRHNINHAMLTATDMLVRLNRLFPSAKFNINNIGKTMKQLGFERKSMRRGVGKPVYYWFVSETGHEQLKDI